MKHTKYIARNNGRNWIIEKFIREIQFNAKWSTRNERNIREPSKHRLMFEIESYCLIINFPLSQFFFLITILRFNDRRWTVIEFPLNNNHMISMTRCDSVDGCNKKMSWSLLQWIGILKCWGTKIFDFGFAIVEYSKCE